MPLFRTKDLCFKGIIEYPDLELLRGQVHFIVGESGCGKSTLLKLFNHSISPDRGRIFYEGVPLDEWEPLVLRRQVSLVAQEAWLFPGSIRENFHEVHRLRELPIPVDLDLEDVCRLCRVNFPLDKDTATLSGGERHRLFLALFLILKPHVLMLDEPTAALDEKNTHEVIGNVIHFCKDHGIALIVVSHDRSLEDIYSENTIELMKGGC